MNEKTRVLRVVMPYGNVMKWLFENNHEEESRALNSLTPEALSVEGCDELLFWKIDTLLEAMGKELLREMAREVDVVTVEI